MRLTGKIICQRHYCGVTEEKANSVQNQLTPSAAKLQAALKELSEGKAQQEETIIENNRSTEAYYFQIDGDKAVEALNHIDRAGNDNSYNAHIARFLGALERNQIPRSYERLPLKQRLEAYDNLKKYSFEYYSYQVIIDLGQPTSEKLKFISSKIHRRITPVTEKDAQDKLEPFITSWDGPRQVSKDDEPTREARDEGDPAQQSSESE